MTDENEKKSDKEIQKMIKLRMALRLSAGEIWKETMKDCDGDVMRASVLVRVGMATNLKEMGKRLSKEGGKHGNSKPE